jgi:hypothetical protein
MSYKVTIDEHGTAYPQFYCDVCRRPIEALEEKEYHLLLQDPW